MLPDLISMPYPSPKMHTSLLKALLLDESRNMPSKSFELRILLVRALVLDSLLRILSAVERLL